MRILSEPFEPEWDIIQQWALDWGSSPYSLYHFIQKPTLKKGAQVVVAPAVLYASMRALSTLAQTVHNPYRGTSSIVVEAFTGQRPMQIVRGAAPHVMFGLASAGSVHQQVRITKDPTSGHISDPLWKYGMNKMGYTGKIRQMKFGEDQ